MSPQQLEESFERMRKLGLDPMLLTRYTNLAYLNVDIALRYIHDAETEFKQVAKFDHQEKKDIEICKKKLTAVNVKIDRTFKEVSTQESFGDLSEYLHEVMFHASFLNDADSQLKVISMLKAMKKPDTVNHAIARYLHEIEGAENCISFSNKLTNNKEYRVLRQTTNEILIKDDTGTIESFPRVFFKDDFITSII